MPGLVIFGCVDLWIVFLAIRAIITFLQVLKLNFNPIVNRQITFALQTRDPFVSYIGAGT